MRAGIFPLSALMELGQAASEGSIPLPEAVADTLRERFAELQNVFRFEPGALATFKGGFDDRRSGYSDHPLLVIGYDLTGYPPPAPYSAHQYAFRADIALLDMRDDGTAAIRLVDSRMLEPWPRAASPAAESGEA